MRYVCFLLLSIIQLITNISFAATLELDMTEMLPQQQVIQKVQIVSENLQASMTLNNGKVINPLTADKWPSFSEIAQIGAQGPEVQLKVIMQNGSEWSRSLGAFNLEILNVINANRREISLDLRTTLLNKPSTHTPSKTSANFGHYLFKTLMLMADGTLHFYLSTSMDLEKNAHPSMNILYELENQNLTFEVHDQEDALKTGSWKIESNGFGKNSVMDMVIKALHTMSEEHQNLEQKTEYEKLLQQGLRSMDLFLDYIAPITKWTGINLVVQGSFDSLFKDSILVTHINNQLQLDAYDGNWSTPLGSKTYLSVGGADAPAWSQEFNIKNPAQDVQRIAKWIQEHCVNQLATTLNMPSIKYYADYLPKYFIQGLTLVISRLGDAQEDGTVSFKFSSNPDGTVALGGLTASEIASLMIVKIKEKIGRPAEKRPL